MQEISLCRHDSPLEKELSKEPLLRHGLSNVVVRAAHKTRSHRLAMMPGHVTVIHLPQTGHLPHAGSGLITQNSVRVRVARREDRATTVQVINTVSQERGYFCTSGYQPTPQWEQLLDEGLSFSERFVLLVVEVNGSVIGFGRLYPDRCHLSGHHAGNVGLALLPPYRGSGIGSLVLTNLVEWATMLGFCNLSALVLPENSISQHLFGKHGFQFVKTVSVDVEYEDNSTPALLFVRFLSVVEAS